MFKPLLLWQKNEAVPQTQHGKGRTRSQAKVLAKVLWDGKLPLLTDLRSSQIFERRLSACHESPLVGISYTAVSGRQGNIRLLL